MGELSPEEVGAMLHVVLAEFNPEYESEEGAPLGGMINLATHLAYKANQLKGCTEGLKTRTRTRRAGYVGKFKTAAEIAAEIVVLAGAFEGAAMAAAQGETTDDGIRLAAAAGVRDTVTRAMDRLGLVAPLSAQRPKMGLKSHLKRKQRAAAKNTEGD